MRVLLGAAVGIGAFCAEDVTLLDEIPTALQRADIGHFAAQFLIGVKPKAVVNRSVWFVKLDPVLFSMLVRHRNLLKNRYLPTA